MTKKKVLTSIDGMVDSPPKSLQRVKKYNPPLSVVDNARVPHWSEMLGDQSYRLFPDKDAWRERLIASFIEWGHRDDSYELMQYCMDRSIAYYTFREWVEKYPDLKKAFTEVKMMIASRKRIGALKKKLDKDVAFKDMYRYDPEWVEVDKYHAALKKSESSDERNITVVISPMPDVPSIKKLEESK